MNQKFHFAPALTGMAAVTLDALRANKRTLKHKPAILIATDGVEIAAEHPKSGDTLHCAYAELGDRFGFFLPTAGKERYRAAEENPVDVKVSGKLAKLYDALIRRNPDWATEARRHDMNRVMTRLIFCLFAEDVVTIPEDQFSRLPALEAKHAALFGLPRISRKRSQPRAPTNVFVWSTNSSIAARSGSGSLPASSEGVREFGKVQRGLLPTPRIRQAST
jgi:hypothetical protein